MPPLQVSLIQEQDDLQLAVASPSAPLPDTFSNLTWAFATREVIGIQDKMPFTFPCSEHHTPWPNQQTPMNDADEHTIRTHISRACAQAVLHRAPSLGDSKREHWTFQAESDENWTRVADLPLHIARGNVEKDVLAAWHSGRAVCLAKGADDIRATIIAP